MERVVKGAVKVYLRAKTLWSRWLSSIFWQKAPLPLLRSEIEVSSLVDTLLYTGDGPWGVFDFVHDPEHLYWHILQTHKAGGKDSYKNWPPLDCDDFAELAWALFKKMGWKAERLVLVDPGVRMTHVVCWFERPDGETGTVDTNGLKYWRSKGNALNGFSKMYGVTYSQIVTVEE